MINSYSKLKPFLNWLVIIIVGVVTGRELAQFIYDNSQANRIAQLQKVLVLNIINNVDVSELHQNMIELVAHAKNKTKCMCTIQDELSALKHALNDDTDAHSINVSTLYTDHYASALEPSSATDIIKKYVKILSENCK